MKVSYENSNDLEFKKDKHLELEIGRYQNLTVDQNKTTYFGKLDFIGNHLLGINERKNRVVMLNTNQDRVSK